MNDKLKKLALNRKVESRSIRNTKHVVLLLCNGACNVNKGCKSAVRILQTTTVSLFIVSTARILCHFRID